MAVVNPEHLFRQAESLCKKPSYGPFPQVDLRRAISAAYYGLFHTVLGALGDVFAGQSSRGTPRYNLVYRSLEHRTLKTTCVEVQRVSPSKRFEPFVPNGGFDTHIRKFAATCVDLQDTRHEADYDPAAWYRVSDAMSWVMDARGAVSSFKTADADHRRLFLTLLLCPPR